MPATRATLVVFTLGPAGESRRRPLLPGSHVGWERKLRSQCLQRILAAGRSTGCHTVVCAPRPLPGIARVTDQGDGSFGDRLRRVVSDTQQRRPGPVVIVGTDVPELGARQIDSALGMLQGRPDRVVLGPSPDGGFYLLAASRALDEALEAIPWQRPDTRRRLLEALRSRGFEVVQLEPLRDLDGRRDLDRWLASRSSSEPWRGLQRRLRRLLRPAPLRARSVFAPPVLRWWTQPLAGRAPPA